MRPRITMTSRVGHRTGLASPSALETAPAVFAQEEVLGCQCAARPRNEYEETDGIARDGGQRREAVCQQWEDGAGLERPALPVTEHYATANWRLDRYFADHTGSACLRYGFCFAGLRNCEAALDHLEHAYQERLMRVLSTGDSEFNDLRAEPRFASLAQRLGRALIGTEDLHIERGSAQNCKRGAQSRFPASAYDNRRYAEDSGWMSRATQKLAPPGDPSDRSSMTP
jgi:hypothetical protein